MNTEALLKLRKHLKQRKPYFLRQDKKRKKRVKGKWRRPRGHHSKIREKRKGHLNPPSTGYRSPSAVRGLDATGKIPLIVSTITHLAHARPNHTVVIAHTVGQRKKIMLVNEAAKKGVYLALKDTKAYQAMVEEDMKKRKQKRQTRLTKKETKRKEDEQKAKEKAAEKKEETTTEEQKEQQKKELDRILTHQT